MNIRRMLPWALISYFFIFDISVCPAGTLRTGIGYQYSIFSDYTSSLKQKSNYLWEIAYEHPFAGLHFIKFGVWLNVVHDNEKIPLFNQYAELTGRTLKHLDSLIMLPVFLNYGLFLRKNASWRPFLEFGVSANPVLRHKIAVEGGSQISPATRLGFGLTFSFGATYRFNRANSFDIKVPISFFERNAPDNKCVECSWDPPHWHNRMRVGIIFGYGRKI